MNVTDMSDKKEDSSIKGRWPYAAEDLRVDPIKYIYPTDSINTFLNSEGISFICGLRGLGKTLILRAKRLNYMNLPDQERKSFVIIPDNPKNELDALEYLYPPEDRWDILEKNITWTQIWGISIGLSIISNFLKSSDEESKKQLLWSIKNITAIRIGKYEDFDRFLSTLIDWTINTKSNPSQFVNQIISNINRNMFYSGLLSELYNNLFNILMEGVQSGCVVFIDQVDKSWENIMSDNASDVYKLEKLQEIWYSCQIGLIRAVYSFITRNHHIRIYSAIRQEVLGKLVKINDPNFLRYKSKMLILNYEKEDLRKILIKTIQLLESPKNMLKPDLFKTNSIEAFLGTTHVKPLRINTEETENIFDYLYRHTIQRPRDIIYLGSNIAEKPPKKRTPLCIQRLINKNAEENLSDDYLRDLEKLMKLDLKLAYSLINKSVFTVSELKDICQDYNKIQNTTVCDRDCYNCRQTHLFCSLYNVGLFGIIKIDFYDENKYIQEFLRPQDRELVVTKSILPDSEFKIYLLHTVLSHIIWKKRKIEGKEFHFCDLIIGDGCGFSPKIINELSQVAPEESSHNGKQKEIEEKRAKNEPHNTDSYKKQRREEPSIYK